MDYQKSHQAYEELIAGDIHLIEPRMEHAPASLSWVQSINVIQYMGADFPSTSLEGEQKRIRDIINNPDEYSWMMESDGNIIGNVCINSIKETSEKCGMKAGNLTILIGDKDFWGKGIATGVCQAVLIWAKKVGFQMMAARALQENAGSIRTLQKLGFTETGTESYEGLIRGKPSTWRNFRIEF